MRTTVYHYIQLLALGVLLSVSQACNTLDIEPVNNLTATQVFKSEAGVEAVIATCYANLPIAAHNASVHGLRGDPDMPFSNWNNPSILTGEAQVPPLRVGMAPKTLSGSHLSWWDYGAIRYVNIAIHELEANATVFTSNAEQYRHWLGELYFCRAYMYAYMVKSFGGVPIVKQSVSYVGLSEEELYIPRNTENEVVDFIGEDLDMAMELMGPNEVMTGRANRYIAANLKARVMLFAASEAKNGIVQLDGLVGIPRSKQTDYYKKAYEAAQFAIDNGGKYMLYDRYDDGSIDGKTTNFWNLFIDESNANKERMFVKEYDASGAINRPENWSARQLPHGFTTQANSGELSVTTEWMELFEDVDGNPFVLNVGTASNPVRYADPLDLFQKAQPRLRATVLLPGSTIPGKGPDAVFEVRKGIYESYPNGTLHESSNFTDTYQGMPIQGRSGVGNPNTNGNGAVVWKYVDPNATGVDWAGNVDWIEMRYAEVLLNKAEAAVNIIGEEVGGQVITMDDALAAINPVRSRAGLPALATVDEAKVIQERRCELAFENHLLWDLKRWRMFESVLQNKTYHALYPYYIYDEGRYIFKKHNRIELQYTFDAKAYYAPIPGGAINRNPNLLPNNPGY